jgi:hypothetical protein
MRFNIEDELTFDSIVNSKRRIEKLELDRLDLESNGQKLQKIIENIGASNNCKSSDASSRWMKSLCSTQCPN